MGGQTNTYNSPLDEQNDLILEKKSFRTLSILARGVEVPEADVDKKLEMQDTMQAFDSDLVEDNASEKEDNLPLGMSCASDIKGRSEVTLEVKLRRTFESPMRVKPVKRS